MFSEEELGSMEEVPVTLEEPWNQELETRLQSWSNQAKESQRAHNKAGHGLKRKYRLFTFIIIMWSSVILITNGLLSCTDEVYSQMITLSVNAVGIFLNGMFSSLNIGYTYRLHFEYEAKFFDLVEDLEHTLIREREFRMPADALMTEVRERRKKLALAPEMPSGRCFFW